MPLSPGGMVYQQLEYNPGLQDSGDLEPGTLSISGTSKPLIPTYSTTLTIPAPSDSRIVVTRIFSGFRAYITLVGTATQLNYDLYIDGVSVKSGAVIVAGGGAYGAAFCDIITGDLTGAGLYELYLWPDADSVNLTIINIYAGVGGIPYQDNATDHEQGKPILSLDYSGFASAAAEVFRPLNWATSLLTPSINNESDDTLASSGTRLLPGYYNDSIGLGFLPYRYTGTEPVIF